ncbi:hypothetical protein [Paludibaculum fermentans]|uniref:Glycosyl hydrolase-like 10 domain-containing protein n=1 Tax=Paludibaculum fermentans TaxID=1473598 RepID=A0A7S7NLS7_PALFE|nr:hypothetical protein [Paludibaculum fermentans]QOY85920.1 hypothetical protein IRI77_24290 [Paludibaculum fermentans]
MRYLISCLLFTLTAWGSWPRLFQSLGLDSARVTILEGAVPKEGFQPGSATVNVRSVTDRFGPELQIVWKEAQTVPRYELPAEAIVFTRERWTGAPLAAGFRRGSQIVFWTAVPLGEQGYERFPYIPQALAELGLLPRAESRGLWAFFDSSYRLRADPDYLAARWRSGGVSALHIAAWHYWEPDPERDAWLSRLIEACHRHAIVTYAWVELPHVSDRFWADHPEWREQTATGQDAHLDWRKLMNLNNPDCAASIDQGLRALLLRFDWDGVNLGELYFESLEGYQNPARFTPFNTQVRDAFREKNGFDPKDLYDPRSKRFHARDARPMRQFLDYRADLVAGLQADWLNRIESIRQSKPWLDLAFTHVDDRFDLTMRDKVGADAARLLPAAAAHHATFLVEDPATVWHLGPERYEEIARRYVPLVAGGQPLAIDINVVERYQDVYPTKQQTGAELFRLVHGAATAFPQVALYFENSILPVDWPLLAAAASPATHSVTGDAFDVESPQVVAVAWTGCALVNGEPWRIHQAGRLLLPAGHSQVEPCPPGTQPGPLLLDFNGGMEKAVLHDSRLTVTYTARTRAIAVLPSGEFRLLPAGHHTVTLGAGEP